MADCRRQFSQSEEDFRLSMYNRMNENTPSGVFLFFLQIECIECTENVSGGYRSGRRIEKRV